MYDLSIKIQNYKCFKEEAGFDCIKRVNIIIGRNNSGKSSLLDVIEHTIKDKYDFDQNTWRENQKPRIIFNDFISQEVINSTFPSRMYGGVVQGSHLDWGNKFLNREITWGKEIAGNNYNFIECDDDDIQPRISHSVEYAQTLVNNMPRIFRDKFFKRVAAERDISPEVDNATFQVLSNGAGITSAIQAFINQQDLDNELVEIQMLSALNQIFSGDSEFIRIVCQRLPNRSWEIFLDEKDKGRIALSKSGSGLKTVISVLTTIFLIPAMEKRTLNQYIFGFEELENNIHPALLRRLNTYLYNSAIENDFIYFLTTHSNVLIDQFSKQEDAQIIHVTQSNGKSQCFTTKTYIHNNGILDDLDVRASDLLQSNGIIWVEGPSDRTYLNKWIELWSNGQLKEGSHYQIIFYGGRLLSHLSAESPELTTESLSILNANRNAIMLIDSDKKSKQASINGTKKRIQQEFEAMESLCWITKGKEIENYISAEVVDEFFGVANSSQVTPYTSFFDHIERLKKGEGSKYANKKPLLAEQLVSHMTKENCEQILDLNEMMNDVCANIKEWNNL